MVTPALAGKEKAQELFKRGVVEFAAERYDAAVAEFEKAYEEQPDPVFIFHIGQSHRRAKRPGKALEAYRRYLEAAPEAKNRAEVEAHIAELEPLAAAEAKAAPARPVEVAPAEDKPADLPPEVKEPPKEAPAAKPAPAPLPPREEKKPPKPLFGWKWPVWVGIVGGAFLLGTVITIAAVAGSGPDETGVLWSAR